MLAVGVSIILCMDVLSIRLDLFMLTSETGPGRLLPFNQANQSISGSLSSNMRPESPSQPEPDQST